MSCSCSSTLSVCLFVGLSQWSMVKVLIKGQRKETCVLELSHRVAK